MDINGLVYLLNQAGEALAQANREIARLTALNEQAETAA